MDADFSDLHRLAQDLGKVSENAGKWIRKAVEISARNVKDDAKATVSGRQLLGKAAAGSIDYDLSANVSFLRNAVGGGGTNEVTAEIGYNKGKPGGPLGNLIEFGAPNAKKHVLVRGKGGKLRNVPVPGGVAQPLPPSHDLGNALLNNEDDFVDGLAKAMDDTLRESDL